MNEFISSLNYTTCNEDSCTEIKALNIIETDEVFCITGSGNRVLNLLIKRPKKIYAVDFNRIQNYLLEFKIAAIKNLSYEDYSTLLGLNKCKNRMDLFNEIKHDLSGESLDYWERNKKYIICGLIYQGKLERYCKYFSNRLKEAMGEKVDKILSFSVLEDQKKYYENEWKNDPKWQNIIKEHMFKKEYTDQNYILYFGEEYNTDDFFLRILDKGFKTSLIKDNHFISLILDGSYLRTSKLPICLDKENYDILKSNIHIIEIETSDIVKYLEKIEPNKINKFSISDVGGFLDSRSYSNLYKHIIRASKKDAILCARFLKGQTIITTKYDSIIKREYELEKRLKEEDISLEYEIIVGKILK